MGGLRGARARELRREMTPAEKVLWQELRGNKLGLHFRRQQIIAGFIADFYCYAASLIIEVDAGSIVNKQIMMPSAIKYSQKWGCA